MIFTNDAQIIPGLQPRTPLTIKPAERQWMPRKASLQQMMIWNQPWGDLYMIMVKISYKGPGMISESKLLHEFIEYNTTWNMHWKFQANGEKICFVW